MKRRIQQYFITGLLVWLPMGITVWILMWLMGMLDGIFLAVLGAADAVIPGIHPLVERLRNVPGLGVILVAVVIFSTGVFVANMFGQWWVGQWDKLMNRIPVVRSIYTSVKQVADTLFSLLRSGQRSPDGPDRHPVRLGPPPPRPRRRDLHRPARPRRPGAGRLRPGPPEMFAPPKACATSSASRSWAWCARARPARPTPT
jgi:hypothetical protein